MRWQVADERDVTRLQCSHCQHLPWRSTAGRCYRCRRLLQASYSVIISTFKYRRTHCKYVTVSMLKVLILLLPAQRSAVASSYASTGIATIGTPVWAVSVCLSVRHTLVGYYIKTISSLTVTESPETLSFCSYQVYHEIQKRSPPTRALNRTAVWGRNELTMFTARSYL